MSVVLARNAEHLRERERSVAVELPTGLGEQRAAGVDQGQPELRAPELGGERRRTGRRRQGLDRDPASVRRLLHQQPRSGRGVGRPEAVGDVVAGTGARCQRVAQIDELERDGRLRRRGCRRPPGPTPSRGPSPVSAVAVASGSSRRVIERIMSTQAGPRGGTV